MGTPGRLIIWHLFKRISCDISSLGEKVLPTWGEDCKRVNAGNLRLSIFSSKQFQSSSDLRKHICPDVILQISPTHAPWRVPVVTITWLLEGEGVSSIPPQTTWKYVYQSHTVFLLEGFLRHTVFSVLLHFL